jgi:hypothetical protein
MLKMFKPPHDKLLSTLERALALIDRPGKWIQRYLVIFSQRHDWAVAALQPSEIPYCSFCLMGAVDRAVSEQAQGSEADALRENAYTYLVRGIYDRETHFGDRTMYVLTGWNDDRTRNQAEVVNLLKKVIEYVRNNPKKDAEAHPENPQKS